MKRMILAAFAFGMVTGAIVFGNGDTTSLDCKVDAEAQVSPCVIMIDNQEGH